MGKRYGVIRNCGVRLTTLNHKVSQSQVRLIPVRTLMDGRPESCFSAADIARSLQIFCAKKHEQITQVRVGRTQSGEIPPSLSYENAAYSDYEP